MAAPISSPTPSTQNVHSGISMSLTRYAKFWPKNPVRNASGRNDRRDHRQPLHHLVLVVRDLRLVVVAHAGDEVAGELEVVGGAQQLVVGVAEVELDVVREDLVALELDPVVDDLADRVARRRERAADVQQVVPQRREPRPHPLGVHSSTWSSSSSISSLSVVDQVEKALGDVVDEVVGDHRDVLVGRGTPPAPGAGPTAAGRPAGVFRT